MADEKLVKVFSKSVELMVGPPMQTGHVPINAIMGGRIWSPLFVYDPVADYITSDQPNMIGLIHACRSASVSGIFLGLLNIVLMLLNAVGAIVMGILRSFMIFGIFGLAIIGVVFAMQATFAIMALAVILPLLILAAIVRSSRRSTEEAYMKKLLDHAQVVLQEHFMALQQGQAVIEPAQG